MAEDMKVWLNLVKDAVDSLSDEDLQRRAWFGFGPEIFTADDAFIMFLDDAAVEDFLKRKNTGLHQNQLDSLHNLTGMVRKLCIETNKEGALPPTFIDDLRWQEIIVAAKKTKVLLQVNAV